MITVPAVATLPHARLYRDDTDPQLIYVDLLEPAPTRGAAATRWLPIPDSLAYLVGEVSFSPSGAGFGAIPALVAGQRLLPMSWGSAPVYAWYRQGDGVQVVAQGKTSGFGQSNTVFNGTAPLQAMISPVLVAAELNCPAHLAAGQVMGQGRVEALVAALPQAALGPQADWATTLGMALVALLENLVAEGAFTLQVQTGVPVPQSSDPATELRELALLEWAQRIQLVLAPTLTLAAPAALVSAPLLATLPSLDLRWNPGSRVPLRSLRVLRPPSLERAVPDR